MTEFRHRKAERLSRRQAAERLVDVAYALAAGGPLEVSAEGRRVTVPVARELQLDRELTSHEGCVEFGLGLRWSASVPDAEPPRKGDAA